MRWWFMALITTSLCACSLRDLMPVGPVQSPWERQLGWGEERGSGARYQGEPAMEGPLIPLLAWGAAYDLDLVVVSRHPNWDMHEFALLRTPKGPVWLVKESRVGTLDQVLLADLPEVGTWLPELPMVRRRVPLQVEDRSTERRLDLRFAYQNLDGEQVSLHYRGSPPRALRPKRNGSTMGHSRRQVLAVLDLSHMALRSRVRMEVDGRRVGMTRILGLVPFHMALVQTQAGLAAGRFSQQPVEEGFQTTHLVPGGGEAALPWVLRDEGEHLVAEQEGEVRTLRYTFRKAGEALELVAMDVLQAGRSTPACHVSLSPALPDLRIPFEGTLESRYVIDVNGQRDHATGTLRARWTEHGPELELEPEAPWFTLDRPMRTRVSFEDGGAQVAIERLPQAHPSGAGGKGRSPRWLPEDELPL